jgi:hypothetical protein
VYFEPVGLLHWHVPVIPGAVTEQTWPAPHPQLTVPPVPLSSAVPHLPMYAALVQVRVVLHAPVPSAGPQT